ncbi:MAG: hypothetical protein MUF42_02250 [Cytophagaceae bacterium]|jgi:dolichol kinase|nr:hypothetical protein [Cytophagaceae bacterium]
MFLGLFSTSELLYRRYSWAAESTRKLVHIGTGLLTMLFPIWLQTTWQVGLLCGSFLIILLASQPLGLLPSINNINRKSRGSLYYPVIVFMMFELFLWKKSLSAEGAYIHFYLPILVMALCDPLAAYVGRRWPIKKTHPNGDEKSWGGSIAFAIGASLLSAVLLGATQDHSMWNLVLVSMLIGVCCSIAEAFSKAGADNFFIPLAASFVLETSDYWT